MPLSMASLASWMAELGPVTVVMMLPSTAEYAKPVVSTPTRLKLESTLS